MTAEILSHLGLVADASGGLGRLRRLFLSLALEGRFTQSVSAELAEQTAVLSRLDGLRVAHAARGRVSRLQPPVYDYSGEVDRLSNGWPRLAASDVFLSRSGNSKLIKGKLLDHPAVNTYPGFSASGQDVWLESFEHEGDAVVVSAVGARCGKAFRANGRWSAIANTHIVWPVTELISLEFAMLWLNDEVFWLRAGGAQPFIKVGETLARPIPVPPLQEQHRIVAKVDELMTLCDRLEARQQDAEAAHARLVQALLDSLTQARNFEGFQASWQQVADHFETVLLSEESLEALKACIRKLALRGRLVAQEPSEEPADKLLKRVALQRYGLTGGKRASNEGRSQSNENKCPHDIPHSWVWCRLEDIQVFTNGYAFRSSDLHDGPGVGVVKIGDVYRNGEILEDKMQFVNAELASCIENKFYVAPGDMVVTMTGEVKIGFNNSKKEYLLNQRVGKMRCIEVGQNYVFLQLIDVAKSKIENASGGVIPNVSTTEINDTLVPLPPLAEQRRIVAKVSELFVLCDQLKDRIAAARAKHAQLAEALVAQAVAT